MAVVFDAHPRFLHAVKEDARVSAAYRGERHEFRGRVDTALQVLRLAFEADAYLAQVLYRAKASMQAVGIPVLPRIAHRLAIGIAQVCIGDPVVIGPGLYLPHGQVVIDGVVRIERGAVIRPWVTIGLKDGVHDGAHIGPHVRIGTGAKIIGPVTIGQGASIGANAVVVRDVPAGGVAVGVPARVVEPPPAGI
jgi:serine O-acetyltransferase